MSLKILDCTLRDGGYYNQWDFEPNVIVSYLNAMAEAKIDFVELGLRNFSQNGFYGPFAYTTESFLNRLDLPAGPVYGVMVDAKTILSADMSVENAINSLFVDASDSKLGLVRIAAHFHEVTESEAIVRLLKNKGYKVGLNLMQSGGKCSEIIADIAKQAKSWGVLDILYFADSLGNMDAKEVTRIVIALRTNWDGELGIHTHNNMAKALDNTLTANDLGVNWLDVTVTGMGRGAGNAQTECLLATFSSDKYNPSAVYELVIRDFEPLQKKYGWGSSLLYFLGAQNDVHPTYIQNLLSNSRYGTDEIVGAISYLSQLEGTTSFNGDVLETALSFCFKKPVSGSPDLKGKFESQDLLIIANGPSFKRYQLEIEAYIIEHKPVVIAINIIEGLSSDYIDYYCVSHNAKFLSENESYNNLNKPIILPVHRFSDEEFRTISKSIKYYDYGLNVSECEFRVDDISCTIPFDVTTAYALSVAKCGNARKIFLVGFDGYAPGDIRQSEMNEIISLFKTLPDSQDLIALTPSSYHVNKGSVYAPTF